jgi:cytochrome P450
VTADDLSLSHVLDPVTQANPYPLYNSLRTEAPVYWDPFLYSWVVTRHADVLHVLHHFSAQRTPTPEQLTAMGLSALNPIAEVMVRQMIFKDPPDHTHLRALASAAFTPTKVAQMRAHIQEIVDRLLDAVIPQGQMDVIADLASPLPAIVTAEMLGVPVDDHEMLKGWSLDFAEMLGNFQHNPDRLSMALRTVDEMVRYFSDAVREQKDHPRDGLVHAFMTAEIAGERLSHEEIVANLILTMTGGQETTTNLIGNGLLTLLLNPDQLEKLRGDPSLVPSAVDECLRFESPIQHTVRFAPGDETLGGKTIRKRQAVIAVIGAANRDPQRFPDPDTFDVARCDNHHVAFGAGAHFCFGAPLARLEGRVAFETLLRRLPGLKLKSQAIEWRPNPGFRGLTSLHVAFEGS